MKVLGISPLDKDATASLVEDGRILYAAGEERFSRKKQHAGFPLAAIEDALRYTGTKLEELEVVAYPFLSWEQEARLIKKAFAAEADFLKTVDRRGLSQALAAADARVPARDTVIQGLKRPNQKMEKPFHKDLAYRVLGASFISPHVARRESQSWGEQAVLAHEHWNESLFSGLSKLGLAGKLKHTEHHGSHASGAYLASGFDRALIVTLDGYGSGLAGSISSGEGGKVKRRKNLLFPHSLGTFYETVTGALGYTPDKHAGKIVGLAAYGDPAVLEEVVLSRFVQTDGEYKIVENLNSFFARHLATRYPMVDVAAAWQHVLELVACRMIKHWIDETGCKNVVLAGGVAANVKMNQRIHELDGVEGIFVYPNMGDGGCASGIALELTWPGGTAEPISDVYFGPDYGDEEIEEALRAEGLEFTKPENLAAEVARRIHSGEVIARFDGRMEYGPRALGNRTIMYHAREPEVNHWLNKRLGRTEFMPFAPVTLWERRGECYHGLAGAEHTAQYMTITFDCTESMRRDCPAAVHVDGTARPQLIRREVNPGYYDIVAEYEKLSGIPSLINTSFNMHEEPIVCSPEDAVRAFLDGRLDGLAIGSYFVPQPNRD